jgi:hypothetical protein
MRSRPWMEWSRKRWGLPSPCPLVLAADKTPPQSVPPLLSPQIQKMPVAQCSSSLSSGKIRNVSSFLTKPPSAFPPMADQYD